MPFLNKFFSLALHGLCSYFFGTTSAVKNEQAEATLFDL